MSKTNPKERLHSNSCAWWGIIDSNFRTARHLSSRDSYQRCAPAAVCSEGSECTRPVSRPARVDDAALLPVNASFSGEEEFSDGVGQQKTMNLKSIVVGAPQNRLPVAET